MDQLRCFTPRHIYGEGIKWLDFHHDRAPVDFGKWLQRMFGRRDKMFGNPDMPRFDTLGNITRCAFTIDEFAETFFGTYTPGEMTSFFRKWLIQECDQAEAFIRRIEDYEGLNKVVGIADVPGWKIKGKLPSSAKEYRFLVPFNFSSRELFGLRKSSKSIWPDGKLPYAETEYLRSDFIDAKMRMVLPFRIGKGKSPRKYRIVRDLLKGKHTLYTPSARSYRRPIQTVEDMTFYLGLDVSQTYFETVFEDRKTNPEKLSCLVERLREEFLIEHLIKL